MLQFTVYLSIGEDYEAVSMSPLNFEPNSPLASVRCVNITINDDDVIEPDQTFSVELSTTDPVFLEPISMATVVIETDNDSKFNIVLLCSLYLGSAHFD